MSKPDPKLPQDPIAGFANGACFDMRLRFAMQLLASSPMFGAFGVGGVTIAESAATLALDVSEALFRMANERGLIDPIEGDLDEATKAHGERVGAFQVHQQIGQQREMKDAAGRVAVPQGNLPIRPGQH